MKKINGIKLMSHSLCAALALSLMLQPLTPAFADGFDAANTNVSTGDAAKAVPDVKGICEALDRAQSGDFMEKDGKTPVSVLNEDCSNKGLGAIKKMERAGGSCYVTMKELVDKTTVNGNRGEAIEKICASPKVRVSQSARTFCALQQAAKTTQAGQYCEAYREADKAQDGVKIVAALDATAAGVCWAEALTMASLAKAYKTQVTVYKAANNNSVAGFRFSAPSGSMGPGSLLNMGICGGAAVAAGMGEIVQTVRMLSSKKKSAGGKSINGEGNVSDRGNFAKVMELVTSSVGSGMGIRLGLCYYKVEPIPGMCNGLETDSKKRASVKELAAQKSKTEEARGLAEGSLYWSHAANSASNSQRAIVCKMNEPCPDSGNTGPEFDRDGNDISGLKKADAKLSAKHEKEKAEKLSASLKDQSDKASEEALRNDAIYAHERAALGEEYVKFAARANVARQAAIVFTSLTAMRAIALLSAESTKGKAKDLLQTLFTGDPNTTNFGLSAATAASSGLMVAAGSNFTSSGNTPVTSAAIAKDGPDAFLMPPGSALASTSEKIASKIPRGKIDEAAAGGAAGMGGLVSGVAESLGAKGAGGEIQSMMATAFANLPKEGGGYNGGGAARSMASKDSSGADLNLKGLFGGAEDKEHISAGREDIAFRDLASEDDIWHSKNPKGNNLFQIVSDKYDNVQRKTGF